MSVKKRRLGDLCFVVLFVGLELLDAVRFDGMLLIKRAFVQLSDHLYKVSSSHFALFFSECLVFRADCVTFAVPKRE
jgi:hypothetical protein